MWKWAYPQGIHLNHMISMPVIVIPPGETIYKGPLEIKQQCGKYPVGALKWLILLKTRKYWQVIISWWMWKRSKKVFWQKPCSLLAASHIYHLVFFLLWRQLCFHIWKQNYIWKIPGRPFSLYICFRLNRWKASLVLRRWKSVFTGNVYLDTYNWAKVN